MPGPGSYLIGPEETAEVMDVMSSGHLSRYGDFNDPGFKHKVYTLEQEFAAYTGVRHAICTASGTTALLIALQAMGLKPGDEVIVPGYTFVASYGAIVYAGGVPVLAEIDESLTLDPADIERRITPKTKAIMPVHMLGNACDMDPILEVARKHKVRVIEDACQAAGASYHGRKVGSMGDAGAFSLNVFKTITAGDGGIFVTDDESLYTAAFGYHDQGHSPRRQGVEINFRHIIGLNYRVNELTGAVALAQFRKIDRILAALHERKAKFREAIGEIPGMHYRKLPDPAGDLGTLLTVLFDDAARAAKVAEKLGSKTVSASGWHVYYNMEHAMRHLESLGRPHEKGMLPQTDDILSRAINLSVGVVDGGLGAGFGINIHSTDDDITAAAQRFREAAL